MARALHKTIVTIPRDTAVQPFIPHKLPLDTIASEPLIALLGKVNRSLAYYDGVLKGLPNPELLLSLMTTQEAVLSSTIEGTQASLSDVLKSEAGEIPTGEARQLYIQEILNYRKALKSAEGELKTRPFNLNRLLRALQAEEGAWNKWIAFFLEALTEQAKGDAEKATRIIRVYDDLTIRVIETTRSQFAVPILDQKNFSTLQSLRKQGPST